MSSSSEPRAGPAGPTLEGPPRAPAEKGRPPEDTASAPALVPPPPHARGAPDVAAVPISAEELTGRIRLQVLFRLVIAVVLLALIVPINASDRPLSAAYDFGPLYATVVGLFLLTIAAAFALRLRWSVRALMSLVYTQLVGDIALTTSLVYLTGGNDSLLSFVYALVILNASAVLSRRGVLAIAAISAIAYGALLDLTFYGAIPAYAPDIVGGLGATSRETLYKIAANGAAFMLTGFLASYLTEQLRHTREELRARRIDVAKLQALNQLIISNIQSGLLTVDDTGHITSLNPAAQQILGVDLADAYEMPINTLFPGLAADATGAVGRQELSYRRQDGRALILGFSASPLRDASGRGIGTIIAFQDLTELRDLEERVRRDERLAAVGRLAAGIAHEIRNPLASISGSIELLQSELNLNGEELRLMQIVIRETDRLDDLIGEFLSYVRPEAIRRVPTDLVRIARETIQSLSERPALESIDFDLVAAPNLPSVHADPQKITQVLYNLLLNAADAMPGGGTVTVELSALDDGAVRIEITDRGMGIPPEELARVFDPFFTTKEGGTGLGLAIVHKIVEGHRGYIEVDSEPGVRTTFRITLPPAERDPATGPVL